MARKSSIIAAVLAPGLEAYRRGDLAAARTHWSAACLELEAAPERELALALANLAEAIVHQRTGEADAARVAFAEAEAALGGLDDQVLGVDVLALRAELARGIEAAASAPPAISPYQRFPWGPALRFAAFLAVLACAVLALRFTPLGEWLDRERLIAFFEGLRGSPWAPLVLLGLYVGLAPFGLPLTPLVVVGGVIFGPVLGGVYNIVGSLLNSAIAFQVAKLMGRDFVRRIAGNRLRRVENLLRRRGFWSLVSIRFVPVPAAVVNFGAALAGVPFLTFVLSTAVGITPALLVYTAVFWKAFRVFSTGGNVTNQALQMGAVMAVFVALSLVPALVQRTQRRKRYRRLVVERHARRHGAPPDDGGDALLAAARERSRQRSRSAKA